MTQLLAHKTAHIDQILGACGYRPYIRGTKIPVWLIVKLRREDFDDALLKEIWPVLTDDALEACSLYQQQDPNGVEFDVIANSISRMAA